MFDLHKAGERPGKGSYQCTTCGEIIVLEDDKQSLPRCKCRNPTFVRIE